MIHLYRKFCGRLLFAFSKQNLIYILFCEVEHKMRKKKNEKKNPD